VALLGRTRDVTPTLEGEFMTVVVDLSQTELAELKTYTKQIADAEAVRSAMLEFLRFAKRMQLKEVSGKVEMDDNWKQLETAELEKQHGSAKPGAR
jgi:hypothetical protein